MHVLRKVSKIIELKSFESCIDLYFFKWGLLIGTDWYYLTLFIDTTNNIAKSILLSKSTAWELASACISLKTDLLRVPLSIDYYSLWFSSKHCLDLFEKWSELWLCLL